MDGIDIGSARDFQYWCVARGELDTLGALGSLTRPVGLLKSKSPLEDVHEEDHNRGPCGPGGRFLSSVS